GAVGTSLDLPLLDGGVKVLHGVVDLPQSGHPRGPGRQHVPAVELVDLPAPHRRHPPPAGSAGDAVAVHRLTTPGRQDDLRVTADHFIGRHDALAGDRAVAQLGEDVAAAGNLDELRDPADAGDEWIVPLLAVHARAIGPHTRVLADLLDLG